MTGEDNRALAWRRRLLWVSVLALLLFALFVGAPLFLAPGDDDVGAGDSERGAISVPADGPAAGPGASGQAAGPALAGDAVTPVGGEGRENVGAGSAATVDAAIPSLGEAAVRRDGDETNATRGFILDAVSGDPVAGANVRLSWFHGSTALSRAGLSPLAAVIRQTAGDGSFRFPEVDPEDPRLRAHVQINHPGYSPEVCVLHGRQDSRGRWTKAEGAGDTPDLVVLGGRGGGPGPATASSSIFAVR